MFLIVQLFEDFGCQRDGRELWCYQIQANLDKVSEPLRTFVVINIFLRDGSDDHESIKIVVEVRRPSNNFN